MHFPCAAHCGTSMVGSTHTKIVGGTTASQGEFPWQVSSAPTPHSTHTHTHSDKYDVWHKQASSQINCVLLSGVADVRRKSRVRRYSDWFAVGRHSRALFWRVYCYITTHITFISIFMEYTLKIRFTFVSWNQRSLPRLYFYKVTTTPDIGQWVWACTIAITCTRVRCITCVIW